MSTAHPRRRGEHSEQLTSKPKFTGSSPQARGARVFRWWAEGQRRLIPAGAGSTGSAARTRCRHAAHPRRRGEHPGWRGGVHHPRGSSPQARGAHPGIVDRERVPGLIPAGAGSTDAVLTNGQFADGSSPQARGAHERGEVRFLADGLIPAGAGSTNTAAWRITVPEAHPRRRGEHSTTFAPVRIPAGSSPQARGAPRGSPCRTPARSAHPRRRGEHVDTATGRAIASGSSPQARGARMVRVPCPPHSGAHPRRRGEHSWFTSSPCSLPGSSPQARGALTRRHWTGTRPGLIPAGAGSTSHPQRSHGPARAHPRRRGEHMNGGGNLPARPGSSPQARGAQRCRALCAGRVGLIPAGAGSTTHSRRRGSISAAHPRRRGEHTW